MPDKTEQYDTSITRVSSVLKSSIWIVSLFLPALAFLFFAPTARAVEYYVNDTSTNLDVWCASTGDDSNDGLTPATPKNTVQAVLDNYDLEPGDTVHIDTGEYTLTSNIEITSDDQGSATAPVIFEASPYGVVIDRNHTSYDDYAIFLNNADYIILRTAQSNKYQGTPEYLMKITGGAVGVYLYYARYCTLTKLDILSNSGDGIYINEGIHVTYSNNIIHDNNGNGICVSGNMSWNNIIVNNTIMKNYFYQIQLQYQIPVIYSSVKTTLKNNIIWADGINAEVIRISSEGSIEYSDYNLFYTTGGADFGYYLGSHESFENWREWTGTDLNSLSIDPRFVDAVNGDYHLKGTEGSYHDNLWTADAESSPGIDAGDPLDDFSNEPMENGGRVNLGAYGGTEQASKSPTGREIFFKSEYDGEILKGDYAITWFCLGRSWLAGDTLKIEYSNDNGATWNIIEGSVLAEDGYYLWDTTLVQDSPLFKIRLTSNDDPGAFEESDGWFYVHNGPIMYYVNDGSNNLDEWCTGTGDDANYGLTPATPKASVQSVLETYNLEPGDVVYIDTGNYISTTSIEITSSDQGSDNAPVLFEASPYGVIIDSSSRYGVFNLDYSKYITIRTATSTKYPDEAQSFMKLTGNFHGICLRDADYSTISRLEISSNIYWGIDTIYSSNTTYSNNLIHDNGYYGIVFGYGSDNSIFVNNTVVRNGYKQIDIDNTSIGIFKNNIIWTNGSEAYGIYLYGTIEYSDYNLIYATNGAYTGYYGTAQITLPDWQAATGGDSNSFPIDPGFVDSVNDDYHLRSTSGSYHDNLWTADAESSPGIDMGDPLDDFSNEFVENGGRINLGAYGGTEYASKTPSESERILLTLSVDEIVKGIYKLEWFPIGPNWQTGDTLKIEYSNNNGISWNLIAGSALAEDGFYFWDTTSLPDSPYYKIRITSNEDSNVYKESEDWFYVHNGPIHYYVNDDSNNLDEWCTGVGNNANNGLTPATPKASVQAVLDSFDLEEGDIIHIDTGNYYLTNNIEITESDQGTDIAPVIVEGSPYGVNIDGNSIGSGSYIYLNESDYVTIRTATSNRYPGETQYLMKSTGIRLDEANFCTINKLEISSVNGHGVYSFISDNVTFSNNLVYNNEGYGIDLYYSDNNIIINNTIVLNGNDAVYLYGSANVTLMNNIIWASGSGDYGIYRSYGSIGLSNYNIIYATNGSYIGYNNGKVQNTLTDWQNITGLDLNSLTLDPKFVAPGNDFHLKSTAGSYHGGVWLTDAGDSPGIDAGAPGYDFGNEPLWNGGRINLGAYGGTKQASKTLSGDIDDDGLSDGLENYTCTDTYDPDTDDDGIPDGVEDLNHNGIVDNGETDPCDLDTDNDGIPDGVEDSNHNGIVDNGETDPCDLDTDNDGIPDGIEDADHNAVVDAGETDPCDFDTDGDGMPDGWEIQYDLDPLFDDADEDADGDGFSNLKEYQRKTDPNDYNSHPSKGIPWLPLLLGDD